MKQLLIAAVLLVGGDDPGFTVHEWGTFTSLSDESTWQLEWRPLGGPSDLPGFVYGPKNAGRSPLEGKFGFSTVRMETPVIYFYSDREREVSAKVLMPQGRITEWYPRATAVKQGGYDWGKIQVLPKSQAKLLHEGKPSHYYPAREVDAATLRVGTEHEKFLFYRGVGHFGLPLQARRYTDDTVILTPADAPVENVILFENRGGKLGFTLIDRLTDKVKVERPLLNQTMSGIRAELERALLNQGLYPKEASAMLETWKDTWFEEGLRAFYIVPRKTTDQLLPLEIKPAPKATVRVLVGRAEILTPAFEAKVEAVVDRLNSDDIAERQAAVVDLKKLGRFAHPVLRRLHASLKNKESMARVTDVLYR
ncbi:MAG TPA: hypothetical protein VF950_23650 [Planctomycetota bacterium]